MSTAISRAKSWLSGLAAGVFIEDSVKTQISLRGDLPKSKKRNSSAGSKLSRKCGQLTCRHPVGTHHKL